tara:strand:- start:3366 stop:4151 length:786 start_codon:yes stop_codon:yes gene_type:complete
MKRTTITVISLASFAFGFALFSNDPAVEPQNHDVEKEFVLEEDFQNKEFQTDIAFIEGKEEEEKILGFKEKENIETFNDIKETKSSYISMSHSEINFELLDKVESYLKNNENGLIAYGTFSFEHDLKNLFENMKNDMEDLISKDFDFEIVDPYGNNVVYTDCNSSGMSISNARIGDGSFKIVKTYSKTCKKENSSERMTVKIEKYIDSNFLDQDSEEGEYNISYSFMDEDNDLYYKGYYDPDSNTGIVAQTEKYDFYLFGF